MNGMQLPFPEEEGDSTGVTLKNEREKEGGKLLLTISQTWVKVMCKCGPVGKRHSWPLPPQLKSCWNCIWHVSGVCISIQTRIHSTSHQNTDFHSLFSQTHTHTKKTWLPQVSLNSHAEHIHTHHTHTHQWSGKSMPSNWAAWSFGHAHIQCPAVWNETNERSVEKQLTLRAQRSGVSASGMSHLSLSSAHFSETLQILLLVQFPRCPDV